MPDCHRDAAPNPPSHRFRIAAEPPAVQAVYAFILALSIATVLTPLLIRAAGTLRMTDLGGGRKVHEGVTPRTGGIGIVVAALVSALLLSPPRPDVSAFLAAAAVLFLFGLLDDRFDLDFRLKLLGQGIAALIVTTLGGVLVMAVPLLPMTIPFVVSLPLTLFVLVAATNAVNLSDGLDGLAGGISLLAVGSLVVLAYEAGDLAAVTLGLAVLGATFGFLRFNTHPALLFMGDTGSQFLGFSAGVLAVIVTQISNPELSPTVPLLLLGMPILDTLVVMIGRLSRGQSPFSPDRTHLHHRLLNLGLGQMEAVALIYGSQFIMVLLGYTLRFSTDWLLVCAYLGCCMMVLAGIRGLEYRRAKGAPRAPLTNRLEGSLRDIWGSPLLTRGPRTVTKLLVPALFLVGALGTPEVGTDIGILAGILLVALISAPAFGPQIGPLIPHLTAYVVVVTVVYLLNRDGWMAGICPYCIPVFFGGLALSTAVWMRFSSRRFSINPQDILILLVVTAVSSLPSPELHDLGLIAIESLLVFYAIEILLEDQRHRWDILRISLLLTLGILMVRGLWHT